MDPTLQRILLPALAGAAGTGALSAYLTHRSQDPQEAPAMRRRRLLRNALIGSAAGGVAGAALPSGLRMLAEPFTGGHAGISSRLLDAGAGTAFNHAAAGAVGVAGGLGINRSLQTNRRAATGDLLEWLNGTAADKLTKQDLKMHLGTPEGRMAVLDRVSRKFQGGSGLPNEGRHALFKARELMQEGGYSAPRLGELQDLFKSSPVMGDYANYLKEQGGPVNRGISQLIGKSGPNLKQYKITRWLSQFRPAEKAVSGLEGMTGNRAAELYGNLIRPGAKNFMGGRMGILGKLGLLGAGMGGAEYLQRKLLNQ